MKTIDKLLEIGFTKTLDNHNEVIWKLDDENGDLVKCSVCGEYNKEEHMTRARFDYNEEVCPDCKRDGN